MHQFEPTPNGGSGIDVFTDGYRPLRDVRIDANEVYDVGLAVGSNELVQGIYISIPCRGCAVTNNVVHGVTDFGIHAFHRPRYWLVANNTVYGNGRGILTGPRFVLVNNVSAANLGSAYDLRGSLRSRANIGLGAGAHGAGITREDPLLVDPRRGAGGDFRPSPGSPAIDAGSARSAPVADIDGVARPQGSGVDVGAYELAYLSMSALSCSADVYGPCLR